MNARDALPAGGKIEVSACTGQGESIVIAVADSGEGILPENIEKIFEPFFTTKEPGAGTGLGLAISARLVESFGGKLTVASEPGAGAKFTLTLPVVKCEE
jgi:signal transduction histidine kinase